MGTVVKFTGILILSLVAAGCRPSGVSPQGPGTLFTPPVEAIPSTDAEDSGLPAPAVTTVAPTLEVSPPARPDSPGTPSPTPAPVLEQWTNGGCCVGPFWSPDGRQVRYIDRPSPQDPAGLWAVEGAGGAPQFFSGRLGIFSPDMSLRAFPEGGLTVIERQDTGERWIVPNGGRPVAFSLDGARLAWTAGDTGPPFDRALREVWVSSQDGSQARQVFSAIRGGLAGWFPDDRLLVSGYVDGPGSEQAYWALNLLSGAESPEMTELGRGGRLREAQISPGGRWLAYLVTQSEDPALDGLWVADTSSGERRRLDVFGGFNWRDDERLLVVPLDLSAPFHHLIQVQAESGAVTELTNPTVTPFKIANGDWSVSPAGDRMVFVSAQDGNIWVLAFPEAG